MLMKRRLRISTATAFAAALLLLVTDALAGNYGKKQADIVDTAISAGTFSTLAAALEAGDLVGTLKADGPYTVFAPNDEAFAKLPAGTVESLLLPENKDKLVAILTYHVVPGKVTAAEVVTMQTAPTVNGDDLSIRVVDDTVFINDSRVVATDIGASNGVIHVVDTVILPN
ncbi:MAG: fasciclin domain-containing protein [Xanthomonadales bacterium]|nr:fasciclin domain-containing protein [Xanthomonadales bacterium]